jgi:hypothetical protein
MVRDSLHARFCADRNLYTIQALPLSDVRFIRRHTPTFGLEYIIIVLSSGEAIFLVFISLYLTASFEHYCLHLAFLLLPAKYNH